MSEDEGWVRAKLNTGEDINLVVLLHDLLTSNEIAARIEDAQLVLPDAGLQIVPRGWEIAQINNRTRTVTTINAIDTRHFPKGLIEFQHGLGDTLAESLRYGFEQWLRIDFPVLASVAQGEMMSCSAMEIELPESATSPARRRRIALGPPAQFTAKPIPEPRGTEGEESSAHDFCPCCLTTNSFDAFKPLLESNETFGVRLYAARDDNGEASADCRVNGEDFTPGAEALRAYAANWPDRGFEFRKQYVIYYSL